MTKKQHLTYFTDCISAHKKESWVKSHYPIFHRYLQIKYNLSHTESLYLFLHNLKKHPRCKICNNVVRFQGLKKGYAIYCSKICARSDKKVIDKFLKSCEKTNLERHGVKYAWQAKQTKESIKKTNLEKFGVENPYQSKEIQQKIKETHKKRLGVEHPLQSKKVLDKLKSTNMQRYGVENVAQSKEIQEKIKTTNIEKYNVEHVFQAESVKKTIKKTLLKKYGVENIFQSNTIKQKIKNTNLLKYGVEYPSQSKNIRDKINLKNNQTYINTYESTLKELGYRILKSTNHELEIQCPEMHNSKISKKLFQKRLVYEVTLCPICNDPHQKTYSDWHRQIVKYIKSIYDGTIVVNTREIIRPNEFDIYIPEFSLAIECNGIYWHSDLYRSKTYHQDKFKLAHSKKIKLIQIWEDDWKNLTNIIKSKISSLLKKSPNKYYARKCIIKSVNTNDSKTFLNLNHLQGSIKCKYKIGLYYQKELISLMAFSNKRNSIKLERFCSKLNYNIHGAANTLLKYFIIQYTPKQILTYATLDWEEDFYNHLNFKLLNYTSPGYWYLYKGTKHNKTEFEMNARNIPKIWNSGNAKWIWTA